MLLSGGDKTARHQLTCALAGLKLAAICHQAVPIVWVSVDECNDERLEVRSSQVFVVAVCDQTDDLD
eukprot:CAMPEP_0119117924 /NCGR_PEP_ID=MMETSP1180-20130426/53112_1 /TAXON_ID=3052 ORGANISM="Chlamydomonas cf sp, Strain CCMP681" /NCGR_SAMPLE_ID=MMETSP1180 /ASSEMBLY_ACC=CAM_ASM_000741 /LENGTH=66 /DNA_ID=CAMNT_0007107239 /DNA_START=326 /DNA_END=526 /DNA_ORIENTATION=-